LSGTAGPSETEQVEILNGRIDGLKILLEAPHDPGGPIIKFDLRLADGHMKGDAAMEPRPERVPSRDLHATFVQRGEAVFGLRLLTLANERGEAQIILEAAGMLAEASNQVSTTTLSGQIERELLLLANSELAKGRSNARENRALALLLKYLWPSEALAPSVNHDSLFGFQIKLTDLQPLIDDAKRRLEFERAMHDQQNAPKVAATLAAGYSESPTRITNRTPRAYDRLRDSTDRPTVGPRRPLFPTGV